MTTRTRSVLVITMGCLAGGARLWSLPADEVALLSREFLIPWAIGAAVAALLAQLVLTGRRPDTPPLIMLGYILAVLARVLMDTAQGTAAHTLWPIEMVIGGTVGFVGGLVGMLVGLATDRSRRKGTWR